MPASPTRASSNGRAASLLAALAVSASACSALTGLDQINESACAPYCGDDGGDAENEAAAVDVARGNGDASGTTEDASSERATEDDSGATGFDATSADTGTVDQGSDGAGPDAPDAREPDSGVDSSTGTDSGIERDTGTVAETGTETGVTGPCGTVYFSDSFDDNSKGWTLGTNWSIAETCAKPPAPQKGNPDPTVDHTTGAAGGIAGAYVCGNNPAGASAPAEYAVSPVVDLSQASAATLTFYRWLNSDESTYMTSTVDVYDGTSWVNLYTNGSSAIVTDAAWTKQQFPLTPYLNAHLQVRFGFTLVTASVYSMSCWNVDDVTISSIACP